MTLFCISDVGQHAEDYIKNGALVPDDVMIKLITNQLKTMSNHSWLLDGKLSSSLTFTCNTE